MSDKIKKHPFVKWLLCVLLTTIDTIAVIWSFIFGYILIVDYLIVCFKWYDLAYLIVLIVCTIGAILIQRIYFTKFIERTTKDED